MKFNIFQALEIWVVDPWIDDQLSDRAMSGSSTKGESFARPRGGNAEWKMVKELLVEDAVKMLQT